jgi:zinc protease
MLAFYDMPLDYLDTFKQRINAVTIEQIQDAFQRRINPNKMVTVLVGGQAKEQK